MWLATKDNQKNELLCYVDLEIDRDEMIKIGWIDVYHTSSVKLVIKHGFSWLWRSGLNTARRIGGSDAQAARLNVYLYR
ncbi:unnamed protein product [Arabis nemorensis]|uniref:Uncharacterized protein n=1 Tax=Arabis nemorensis TaxID=586526 RepID=A0A565BT74_9BRAS|nr:unnamed protein product [Arabis nemorensis]